MVELPAGQHCMCRVSVKPQCSVDVLAAQNNFLTAAPYGQRGYGSVDIRVHRIDPMRRDALAENRLGVSQPRTGWKELRADQLRPEPDKGDAPFPLEVGDVQ